VNRIWRILALILPDLFCGLQWANAQQLTISGTVRDPQTVASGVSVTEARVLTRYEAYYLDRHHQRPLPALFVQLNDKERSMYYIDPKTARVVEAYDAGSRWNRWLYHGLHSLNFPWLYEHSPAWDILMLVLLAGGTWLCITSIILAGQVLAKKAVRKNQPVLD
jgi:hypothetical protein